MTNDDDPLHPTGDVGALRRRYDIVVHSWPTPRLVALLDSIVAASPEDPWGPLTRARMMARAGALEPCRELVESLLADARRTAGWSPTNLRVLLQAIQIACCDHRRIALLERLSLAVLGEVERDPSGATESLLAQVRLALEDYDGARRILAALLSRGVRGAMIEGMWNVCVRREAPAFPDFAAPKVFCIGLSKTATTSLTEALGLLGLRSIHWINPYTQMLIGDADFLLFDALSDIGVSYRFEQLSASFANARFVYTTRSMPEWARSITAHYQRGYGVTTPADLLRPGLLQRFNGASGRSEANLYARHDSWEDAYADFDRRVRRFFADKPAGTLLELAICEGDGWEKVCGFLGCPIPRKPFPLMNPTVRRE